MLAPALILAEKGMAIFPCRPRDKRPATEHGCKDATRDPEVIKAWWGQRPDYNIGIATGIASGVFVVDVDGDGESELQKLEADYGALPSSVEAITARGRHYYLKAPKAPISNSAGVLAPHVDIRGDGGYVLAPPSVHPSGKRYCWSVDSARTFAEAPAWLIEKVSENTARKSPALPTEWRALLAEGVSEGQRNNAAARLCGYLLRHHVDPVAVLELLRLWNAARCHPPLAEDEIAAVADSIAKRELKRRGAQ